MRYAPEQPDTLSLQAMHPLSAVQQELVTGNRHVVSDIIRGQIPGFLGIIGACALTGAKHTISQEGDLLNKHAEPTVGLMLLNRLCPWKPRSSEESWFGEETTNPVGAYATIVERAKRGSNLAIEMGHYEHLNRYGQSLVLGWFGGRNDDLDLKQTVALADQSLTLAIKNPLSGNIEETLEEIQLLNQIRDPGAAPVILMYRGGENAQTPDEWEKQYIDAFEQTRGTLIVDTAHGCEMAHDPSKNFGKSSIGQIVGMRHLIALAENGYAPLGSISEASRAESPVDPPMPLMIAVSGVKRLHAARLHQMA